MSKELLLSYLPNEFSHKIEKFVSLSETDFLSTIRANVKCEDDVKKWKAGFEKLSGTNFIVWHNFSNVIQSQYHIEYVCHWSKKNHLDKGSDTRRKQLKLNEECRSKLDIVIKFDTIDIRKRDTFVRQGNIL